MSTIFILLTLISFYFVHINGKWQWQKNDTAVRIGKLELVSPELLKRTEEVAAELDKMAEEVNQKPVIRDPSMSKVDWYSKKTLFYKQIITATNVVLKAVETGDNTIPRQGLRAAWSTYLFDLLKYLDNEITANQLYSTYQVVYEYEEILGRKFDDGNSI